MKALPFFVAPALAALMAASPARSESTRATSAQFLGSATCAGSNCHGRATPPAGSRISHDEFLVWDGQDAHSNAFRLLSNPQGKRIARNLGLSSPTETPECLACHSNPVPARTRGPRFRLNEGVGCEVCHGGAGQWLTTHSNPDRTYEQNLAAGMVSLADPSKRARVCLQCHFGSDKRPMTHRLMAAGHPPLIFELDTFTAIQPAHFQVDAQYRQRKPATSGAKTWALGQMVASESLLLGIRGKRFSSHRLFPELVFYDCRTCHQDPATSLTRIPSGTPGAPALAAAPLLLTGSILSALLPEQAPAWNLEVGELLRAAQRSADGVASSSGRLLQLLKEAEARVLGLELDNARALALVSAVADTALARSGDSILAEQASMALGALCNHLVVARGAGGPEVAPALGAVQDAVGSRAKYDPGRFAAAVKALRSVALRQLRDGP